MLYLDVADAAHRELPADVLKAVHNMLKDLCRFNFPQRIPMYYFDGKSEYS